MEAPEMRRRFETARVARLATVSPEGVPHVVPCTFALAPAGGATAEVVYSAVDHKRKRTSELARLRDIEAARRAAVLVDHYDDDWDDLWWVRVTGAARVLREGDERERALDLLAERYTQYRDRRPDGPVIAVSADEWRAWSAS